MMMWLTKSAVFLLSIDRFPALFGERTVQRTGHALGGDETPVPRIVIISQRIGGHHFFFSHAFKHPIDGLSGVTMTSLRKISTDLPLLPISKLKEGFENVKDALKDSLGSGSKDEDEGESKPEGD